MDLTQLLKGVLDTAVLAVLEHDDGYGYDIVRRLREAGFTDIGDASVYGTLRRLYSSGALSTYVLPSEDGPHRKYYSIQKAGQKTLAEQRITWLHFSQTMSLILGNPQDPTQPRTAGSKK